MNIKNLKIYQDLSKFSKTRLVALSLIGTTLFTVGGCKTDTKPAEVKKDASIVEVIDCLSKVDKLTTIDENMKKPIERSNGTVCSIEDLQNEFNEAINTYDIDTANACLYDIGSTALKSLLASTYNINFDEIKNLYITMIVGNKVDENGHEEYEDNYYCPIIFDYKNTSYAILPEGKLAREIAYYLHMTYYHSLTFEDALNGDIDNNNPPAFCCCFHKHKTSCYLVNNLQNELYNDNNIKEVTDLIESIPHFYHLYPDCYYNRSKCDETIENYKLRPETKGINFPEKSFCCHLDRCFKEYKNLQKIHKEDKINIILPNEKTGKKDKLCFHNYCCCKEDPKMHNINYIFQKDFSAENKNNEIRFRNPEVMRDKIPYIPNSEKMVPFIGNNKVIYEVIKFFSSNDMSLSIYGNNMEDLKKLGNIIIEYYKEKYYYIFESNKTLLNTLYRSNSAFVKNTNLNTENVKKNSSEDEFMLSARKTAPSVGTDVKFDIIQIDSNSDSLIAFGERNINKIYFVYVDKIDLKNKLIFRNNKIVWFCNNQSNEEKSGITMYLQPLLQKPECYLNKGNKSIIPNEYIKFQNNKSVRNNWRRTKLNI